MPIISIEGNIGTGKSTLLNILEARFQNIVFVKEPVDEWIQLKNNYNENILEVFYKDKKRWSFTFQMNTFLSRIKLLENIIKNNPNKLIFTERTVQTDKNCFASELNDQNNINELEWKIYNEYYKWLTDKIDINPCAIIYLQVDPIISCERIKKRLRTGESLIELEYLEKIHFKHENWINNIQTPKLILDYSGDIDNPKFLDNIVLKIQNFLNYLETNKLINFDSSDLSKSISLTKYLEKEKENNQLKIEKMLKTLKSSKKYLLKKKT